MALPLSASTASELGKTNGITADSGISFDKVMLAFNNDNNSPFSDEQIRKMTRYAIDAKTIAKNAPIAVRACKQAINEGLQVDMDKAIVIEEKLFGSCFQSADQIEGMSAFLEKRKHEPYQNK